jgi:hypothetical protein
MTIGARSRSVPATKRRNEMSPLVIAVHLSCALRLTRASSARVLHLHDGRAV